MPIVSFLKKYRKNLILFFILILATILRMWGITYGLPLSIHPDEHSIYLTALRIISTGDFNPHFYNWPAHTVIYIDCVVFYLAASLYNFIHGTSFLPTQIAAQDVSLFLILGRLVTVGFSLFGVYMTYKIGALLKNNSIGLLAALLLTILPLHVIHSHYITPDIPITTIMTTGMYFLLLYLKTQRSFKFLILSAVFAGLAVVTKYTSAIFFVPLYLGIILSNQFKKGSFYEKLTVLILPLIIALCTGFLSAPYLFLGLKTVFASLLTEDRIYQLGIPYLVWWQKIIWYVTVPLQTEGGTFFSLFAGIGLILLFVQKKLRYFLIVFFPLFYLYSLSQLGLYWDRWLVPVAPFLCLAVTFAFYHIYPLAKTKTILFLLIALFIIFIILPLFMRTMIFDRVFSLRDTRIAELSWWKSKGLDPKNFDYPDIAADGYTAAITRKVWLPLFIYQSCQSVQKQEKYVVISSLIYERVLKDSRIYPQAAFCYETYLVKNPVVTFAPSLIIQHFITTDFTFYSVMTNDISLYENLQEYTQLFKPGIITGPTIHIYQNY